ncbi:lactose-binding lectin l-2-like [Mercenaria mercenaria]|uniref:lactose-binding lectin l-2-like n=1 Tax=Mercenaria mercenaria TaxID=6596 RepID=UPI00234F71F3|nr:lactose-binding lectin l-2-like [Mercenaria mercenaria]
MIFKLLVWIYIAGIAVVSAVGHLGPEGCERGWQHFKDYCYLAVDAHIHFDSAKAICLIKEATLTSLWRHDEIKFVTNLLINLNAIKPYTSTWIGTGVIRNRWVWLDGSGSLDNLFKGTKLPEASKEVCGYLTSEGSLEFIDCDVTAPVFICKKPLDKIYVPSTFNISKDGIVLPEHDPDDIIYERLWPPFSDRIILNMTSPNYIATVEIAHETDCAYRCYTVDECRAFAVACKSARKCSMRFCRLLSGLDVR